jgi:16S rRNA (uracil1498-N3)-methyltransferase
MSDKHLFSLHSSSLQPEQRPSIGATITIKDNDLWHRIMNVLHLESGDRCIIFNAPLVIHITLAQPIKKGFVSGTIIDIQASAPQKPAINLFQGLVRRDAMEQCAYVAAQMGVTTIIPVLTSKTHRSKFDVKDKERLEKIMISACEQSKQFVSPLLHDACFLEDAFKTTISTNTHSYSFFCDPAGESFFNCLKKIASNTFDTINVFIGPEGGFTLQEREFLHTRHVVPHALTQSILRSQEAVTVCIGSIRSVVR